jgi:hypothetical protein
MPSGDKTFGEAARDLREKGDGKGGIRKDEKTSDLKEDSMNMDLQNRPDYGSPKSISDPNAPQNQAPGSNPNVMHTHAADETDLNKIHDLIVAASKNVETGKNALGQSGADDLDVLDGLMSSLANMPHEELAEDHTIEVLHTVVETLMDLEDEFPHQAGNLGSATKNCTQALSSLTSYRSSLGKASSEEKTAADPEEGLEPSGEEDPLTAIAQEISDSDVIQTILSNFEAVGGDMENPEDAGTLMQEIRDALNDESAMSPFYDAGFNDEDFDPLMDKIYDLVGIPTTAEDNGSFDVEFNSREVDIDGESKEPDLEPFDLEDDLVGEEDRSFNQNQTPNTGF